MAMILSVIFNSSLGLCLYLCNLVGFVCFIWFMLCLFLPFLHFVLSLYVSNTLCGSVSSISDRCGEVLKGFVTYNNTWLTFVPSYSLGYDTFKVNDV